VRLNPNNNLTGNDYINANHVNVSMCNVVCYVMCYMIVW